MSGSVKLWYRVAGPSHGVPVLFLHGGPAEGSQGFARTVGPMLERDLRMIYFDQRGAGHSDRPASTDSYSMAIIVEDIERLRRHLGVERIALVGHSYGSMLALEYAARYPQHVTRIVVAGAVPDSPAALNAQCAWLSRLHPEAYLLAKKAADQPGDPDCIPMEGFKGKARRDYFVEASGGRPETLDRLEEADEAEGVTIGGPAHMALADPSIHYSFSHPERLKMPILAISGSRDRLSDEAPVAIFIGKVARGRLVRYPGAGHFSYVDDPNRFAGDVTSFLR